MPARAIPLRRPPVLVKVEGRFVPQGVSLDAVDAAWKTLCARNPRCFDGPVLQVLGVSRNGHGGVQIHVQESSYRFVAVAALGVDCGARPIGVKGFVRDGSRVLMGRRSRAVANYPGAWEFVPGGTLEPDEAPEAAIVRELAEEAGLEPLAPPVAVAVLFDAEVSSWEIVYRLSARLDPAGGAQAEAASSAASGADSGSRATRGWEYDEFRAVDRAGAESLGALSACARQLLPIAFAQR